LIRIHTVNIKKIKSGTIFIIILAFSVFFISKLLQIASRDISIDFEDKIGGVPRYIKEQSYNPQIYKKIIDQTIPYVDEYSNNGQTVDGLATNIMILFTGINSNKLNTIFEGIIPASKSLYLNSLQYAQNVIEVEGHFEDYLKNEDKGIYQNEEDFYDGGMEEADTFEDPFSNSKIIYTEEQLKDIDFLYRNIYNFQGNLRLTYKEIPAAKLIKKDMTLKKKDSKPQILIFHTHSQENFIDSNPKNLNEGVIGLGDELAKILQREYGVGVLHHKGQYDVMNGKLMRDGSYERVEPAIRKILKQNPSIEVLIDLHRDGVLEHVRLATTIDGKPTAKIMFVNGACKIMKDGRLTEVTSLPNPYREENLAFSLQMQLKGNELYPDLLRKIYIKPYRYTLHMLPKSLIIEVGANTNTLEEAKNSMKPLAEILAKVLELQN